MARTVARAGAAGMWARNMLSITVLGLVESYTSLRILTSWSYEMVVVASLAASRSAILRFAKAACRLEHMQAQ